MKATLVTLIRRYLILGILIFLSACSPLVVIVQPTAQPTQAVNNGDAAIDTPIQAQTLAVPVDTFTPAAPVAHQPVATLAPSATAQPEATQAPEATAQPDTAQAAPTSAPEITGCQDAAQYIDDDGLDGTTYSPNTPFTKTWTVRNTGSCTWDSDYLVSVISGTPMTQSPAYLLVQPGQTVEPGETVDISIGMTSPVDNGSYVSYWGLQKRNGPLMPIQGGAGGNSFYVKIKVSDGSAQTGGDITAASVDIELEQGSGTACTAGATYLVHASLTADGPATATYQIFSSAGQIAAGYFRADYTSQPLDYVDGTLIFNRAETKTIHLRFIGPYPYPDNITIFLKVNDGNMYSAKLSCD